MDNEHRASKTKGFIWLILFCGIAPFLFFGGAYLIKSIPWNWEKSLAHRFNLDDHSDECTHSPASDVALQKLINRIYPIYPTDSHYSINVKVIDDKDVNAHATLGGNITLNSGLLAQAASPEEIAGVLAHEIEHVHQRHILQNAFTQIIRRESLNILLGRTSSSTYWANFFMELNFTRGQEKEADRAALVRLQSAHVDNRGFLQFFQRHENDSSLPGFLSDHPTDSDRAKMISDFVNLNTSPVLEPSEWNALQGFCRKKAKQPNSQSDDNQ